MKEPVDAYSSSLFLVIVIFVLLARIIDYAIFITSPARSAGLAGLFIERLISLLVVELGFAINQVAQVIAHCRGESWRTAGRAVQLIDVQSS